MAIPRKKKSGRVRLVADVLAFAGLVAACLFSQYTSGADRSELYDVGERRVTFLAVGDIMLSRGVARAIDAADDPLAPFGGMRDVLQSTDFNFGNLETPVSGNDSKGGRGLVFNTRTADATGLARYNFKVLNLANNHALDQGPGGLRNTIGFLRKEGISHVGAGDDLAAAWRPKVIFVKGLRIGFVGASYASDNNGLTGEPNNYVARIEDRARLRRAIEELRADGVDFIVASMHAGNEYTRRPNDAQADFAHAAIDEGADMVIGAHPHWMQGFERYRDRYIFYSLGNFIFDQGWSQDTREGLSLRISLRKSVLYAGTRVEKIELIPVIIDNTSTPRPATESEAKRLLEKIGAESAVLVP